MSTTQRLLVKPEASGTDPSLTLRETGGDASALSHFSRATNPTLFRGFSEATQSQPGVIDPPSVSQEGKVKKEK